jgi:8-oxo-dGTP diphosphatase
MKQIKVVAAIIHDGENRILATQRGYGEWKGWWEFPGGKVESDETHEDALIREIKEELSANIRVEKILNTVEYDYPTFHLSMCCYLCTLQSATLNLNEHIDARWVTESEIDCIRWLPADIEVVNELKRIFFRNNI